MVPFIEISIPGFRSVYFRQSRQSLVDGKNYQKNGIMNELNIQFGLAGNRTIQVVILYAHVIESVELLVTYPRTTPN